MRKSVILGMATAFALSLGAVSVKAQISSLDAQRLVDIQKAERTLADKTASLGADHVDVAFEAFALGQAHQRNYSVPGNYGRAIPFYERALAIREKQLPADDPLIVATLVDLALCKSLVPARRAESEPLYRRLVAIYERTLPLNDPKTLANIASLASVLQDQRSKLPESLALRRRVLAVREAAAKDIEMDGDVANARMDLARGLTQAQQADEAETLLLRALATREAQSKLASSRMWELQGAVTGLANFYITQGRHRDALPLVLAADAANVKANPPDGTDAYGAWIANLQGILGHYEVAEASFRRALQFHMTAKPPRPAGLAVHFSINSETQRRKGNVAEAEQLALRAIAVVEAAPNPAPAQQWSFYAMLAAAQIQQQRYAEAEASLKRADEIYISTLPPDHFLRSTPLHFRGEIAAGKGQLDEAETLLKRALALREAIGPRSLPTSVTLTELGLVLNQRGRSAEAEPLLARALATRLRAVGDVHHEHERVLKGLIDASSKLNRTDDVARYSKQLADIAGRLPK